MSPIKPVPSMYTRKPKPTLKNLCQALSQLVSLPLTRVRTYEKPAVEVDKRCHTLLSAVKGWASSPIKPGIMNPDFYSVKVLPTHVTQAMT